MNPYATWFFDVDLILILFFVVDFNSRKVLPLVDVVLQMLNSPLQLLLVDFSLVFVEISVIPITPFMPACFHSELISPPNVFNPITLSGIITRNMRIVSQIEFISILPSRWGIVVLSK